MNNFSGLCVKYMDVLSTRDQSNGVREFWGDGYDSNQFRWLTTLTGHKVVLSFIVLYT